MCFLHALSEILTVPFPRFIVFTCLDYLALLLRKGIRNPILLFKSLANFALACILVKFFQFRFPRSVVFTCLDFLALLLQKDIRIPILLFKSLANFALFLRNLTLSNLIVVLTFEASSGVSVQKSFSFFLRKRSVFSENFACFGRVGLPAPFQQPLANQFQLPFLRCVVQFALSCCSCSSSPVV